MNASGKWVATNSTTLYSTAVCQSEPGTYHADTFGKVNWPSTDSKCNCGSGSIATPKSAADNTKVSDKAASNGTPIGLKRQNFGTYCASKCGHDKDAGVSCDKRLITTPFGSGFVRLTNASTGAVE